MGLLLPRFLLILLAYPLSLRPPHCIRLEKRSWSLATTGRSVIHASTDSRDDLITCSGAADPSLCQLPLKSRCMAIYRFKPAGVLVLTDTPRRCLPLRPYPPSASRPAAQLSSPPLWASLREPAVSECRRRPQVQTVPPWRTCGERLQRPKGFWQDSALQKSLPDQRTLTVTSCYLWPRLRSANMCSAPR